MTLLALESFDGIATADLTVKGWVIGGTPTVSSTRARTGPQSLYQNGTADVISRGVAEHATVIVGFALYRPAITQNAATIIFYSDNGATQHVTIVVTASGALEARRGNSGGTLLGSAVGAVLPGIWAYIEAKATLSDSVGAVELRVNGATVLNLTNVDTKNAGTKTVFDTVAFYGSSGVVEDAYIDDLYVCNGAGSVNNSFLGDTRVRCLLPSGNGNSSQLLGSDADSTDNYLLVDEATPSTADYVGSGTTDQKDTYTFGDLPDASGTIHGVQVSALATKTDAGARNLAIVTRSDGVDYDGSDVALALGSNAYVQQVRETDPDTAAAWTIAAVNAAEFGVKVR